MLKQQKKKIEKIRKRPLQQFARKYYYSGFKFSNFIKKLDDNQIFSYVRYNDGELTCLFGDGKGHNSDKHQYFPQMKQEMIEALTKPSNWEDSKNGTYYFQLGSWMLKGERSHIYMPWVQKFIKENNGITIKFLPKDPIVRSFYNYPEIFEGIIESLNKKHVVMVGPEYMKELKILTSVKHYIKISPKDCYLDQDLTEQAIIKYAEEHTDETIVFLFSASMMTNTLIDKLHPTFKGHHFLIDIGSVLNNFVKKKQNRGYMNRLRKRWKKQYPKWIV